jgi:hypothetical protein
MFSATRCQDVINQAKEAAGDSHQRPNTEFAGISAWLKKSTRSHAPARERIWRTLRHPRRKRKARRRLALQRRRSVVELRSHAGAWERGVFAGISEWLKKSIIKSVSAYAIRDCINHAVVERAIGVASWILVYEPFRKIEKN